MAKTVYDGSTYNRDPDDPDSYFSWQGEREDVFEALIFLLEMELHKTEAAREILTRLTMNRLNRE